MGKLHSLHDPFPQVRKWASETVGQRNFISVAGDGLFYKVAPSVQRPRWGVGTCLATQTLAGSLETRDCSSYTLACFPFMH